MAWIRKDPYHPHVLKGVRAESIGKLEWLACAGGLQCFYQALDKLANAIFTGSALSADPFVGRGSGRTKAAGSIFEDLLLNCSTESRRMCQSFCPSRIALPESWCYDGRLLV